MIPTPTTAVKVSEFTPTQLAYFKDKLKLNGSEVFTLTKPGSNHFISIPIYDNSCYICISDNAIDLGDIIDDYSSNQYTVSIKNRNGIPPNTIFILKVNSTIAELELLTQNNDLISGIYLTFFGGTGSGDGQFQSSPYGLTNNKMNLFVYDTVNIQKFDLDGNFVSKSAIVTGSTNRISSNNSKLYVTDSANNQILIRNLDLTASSSFGSSGSGDGQFNGLRSVFANDNYIYTGEITNDRVQIFDLAGNFVSKFGSSGTGDGQFQNITGISVSNDYIYVVDSTRNDVQIFNMSGNFVSKFGSSGSGDGQFSSPGHIYSDDNYIYVCDDGNDRIQVFDKFGNYLFKFIPNSTSITPRSVIVNANKLYIGISGVNYIVEIFK